MSEDARLLAYRLKQAAQKAYQAWLDARLTPPSDAPAEKVRADWEAIEQFVTEGPDIGDTDDADASPSGQRFN